MTEQGHAEQDRSRPKKSTIITVSLGSLLGLTVFLIRFCSFEGLSELLTVTYQASWVALLIHHGCHVYEGYFRKTGLPREAALELLFLIAWAAAAVVLGQLDDPKLPELAIAWGTSAYLLFHLGADMEEARRRLSRKTDKRLRRASDVIRESSLWIGFQLRVLQVEDARAQGVVFEVFPENDSEDGNLTRMIWTSICAMMVITLIATSAAVAQMVVEPADPANTAAEESDGGAAREAANRREAGGEEEDRETEGDDCNGERDPSGPIPRPILRALSLAWHDVRSLDPDLMEALGYDIGGCPGAARRIPALKSGWYAPGYCEGDLTMLAIAFEGIDHPVVLLEQAADFALPIIREGHFESAEDRFTVGKGDAYVIDSRGGSYVLIRDTASSGPVSGSGEGDGGCGDFVDADYAYTVAGPGLLDPWRSVAAVSPGGVYPIDVATDDPSKPRIALRSTATGILATATCDADLLTCEISFGDQTYRGTPESTITPAEVKALGES